MEIIINNKMDNEKKLRIFGKQIVLMDIHLIEPKLFWIRGVNRKKFM